MKNQETKCKHEPDWEKVDCLDTGVNGLQIEVPCIYCGWIGVLPLYQLNDAVGDFIVWD